MQDMNCLLDWYSFLKLLQLWVPSESVNANEIFNRFSKLYFVLNLPSVFPYQSPVTPGSSKELSFISKWIIHVNSTVGAFMDTPASLTPETIATFKASRKYCLFQRIFRSAV